MNGSVDVIVLKKIHLVIGIIGTSVASILIPVVTGYAAYNRSLAAVNQKIDDYKLESVRSYADKSDVKVMTDKLDLLSNDVSEIKGYLKRRYARIDKAPFSLTEK